jgi:hypothetical protein
MSARRPDWQLRLEAFVSGRQAQPFAWGVNDCAVFAADAVEALTGERHWPHLRGLPTARVALRVLREHGGLAAMATQSLGAPLPPGYAGVGDLVLVTVGRHEALGICNGGTVLGPGAEGVVAVSMAVARAAWRVG